MEPLRLPKKLEEAGSAVHLAREVEARSEPLWPGGEARVARIALVPRFEAELERAFSAGQIVRGLEGAERTLAAEERGQKHVDQRSGVPRGQRVSRLLLLADDGAERFYRNVESLLRRHGPRVLALRLAVDENTLGRLLFGPDQVARLLLVEHKDAVAALLLVLSEEWSP